MEDLDFKVCDKKGFILVTVDDSQYFEVAFENTIHVQVIFNLLADSNKNAESGGADVETADGSLFHHDQQVSKKMAQTMMTLLGQLPDPMLFNIFNDKTGNLKSSLINATTFRLTNSAHLHSNTPSANKGAKQKLTEVKPVQRNRLIAIPKLSFTSELESASAVPGDADNVDVEHSHSLSSSAQSSNTNNSKESGSVDKDNTCTAKVTAVELPGGSQSYEQEEDFVGDYFCEHCERSFRSKASYVQHLQTHMSEASEKDTVSDEEHDNFDEESSDTSDAKSSDDSDYKPYGIGDYGCIECDLGFESVASYRKHLRVEHDMEKTQLQKVGVKFTCGVCGKMFPRKIDYTDHRHEAHGMLTEFLCSYCGLNFKSRKALNEHKSIHIDRPKEYKCTFCDKTFQAITQYLEHRKQAKHGIYCEICKQVFETLGQRHLHMYQVHKEDTDEEGKLILKKCPHCILLFFSETKLKTHEMSHQHQRLKLWICDLCQRRFSTLRQLQSHLRLHSPYVDNSPRACPHCGKLIPRHSYSHHLTRHQQKLFSCNICHRQFAGSAPLRRHMLTHTKEKPYQCEICAKCFSQSNNLTTHMRTHTKEKPFPCPFCDLKFAHKCSLQGHLEKKHQVENMQKKYKSFE